MPHTMIHTLDITGSILSLLSTIYYVRANVAAWPIALAAICLNLSLYGMVGIYGDMSLEFIYLISTFYGWYQWSRGGKKKTELAITNLTLKHSFILIVLASLGIIVLSQVLMHYTNSQVPYWDATTTILSLVAQWLICKKIIQTWVLWFIVDAMYIGLYFYKGIPAHSLLSFVYLGLAIAGWLHWNRRIPQQNYVKMETNLTNA